MGVRTAPAYAGRESSTTVWYNDPMPLPPRPSEQRDAPEVLEDIEIPIAAWQAARAPVHAPEAQERARRRTELQGALDLLEPLAARYYDFYAALRPSGPDGRSYNEERSLFLEHFLTDPAYAPTFVYTHPLVRDGARAAEDGEALRDLRAAFTRLGDPHVRALARSAVDATEQVFRLFAATRAGDDDAFHAVQYEMFGGVTPGSLRAAQEIAARPRPENGPTGVPVADALLAHTVHGSSLVAFFQRALELRGLANEFLVTSVPGATITTVTRFPAEGGMPQVRAPGMKTLNGLELLELEAHEIGVHAVTNANSRALGINATLGWGYELLSEGQGSWRALTVRAALTDTPPDFRRIDPVYVLGLDAIEHGANFREAFDRMFAAHMGRALSNADPHAEASTVYDRCVRIFRGTTDLRSGGRGFFKDKCYLQGAILAERFAAAGIGDVPCRGRFDPLRADDLVAVGVMDVAPAFDAEDRVLRTLADEVRDGRFETIV